MAYYTRCERCKDKHLVPHLEIMEQYVIKCKCGNKIYIQ